MERDSSTKESAVKEGTTGDRTEKISGLAKIMTMLNFVREEYSLSQAVSTSSLPHTIFADYLQQDLNPLACLIPFTLI